ncbi:Translation initiation factor eIF-1A [uncultured virus]|nr:Translation initiation factor eIF-1A [uncultured virus]
MWRNKDNKRELVFREDGQQYTQITKILGNCRVECPRFDNTVILCTIRGIFRKKIWLNRGDIVLIDHDYQNEENSIIHKYTRDEARQLKELREIPENVRIDDDLIDYDLIDNLIDDDIDNSTNGIIAITDL